MIAFERIRLLMGWVAALFQTASALAGPVIREGREAEVEALLAGFSERLPGWSIPNITIDRDRILLDVQGPEASRMVFELSAPGARRKALYRTEQFDVMLHTVPPADAEKVWAVSVALGQTLAQNERNWRWDHESKLGYIPSPSTKAGVYASWLIPLVYVVCWGLLALLLFQAASLGIRLRPWRQAGQLPVLLLVATAAIFAFALRWWWLPAGPGQLVSRIPAAADLPRYLPQFGPAHFAWVLLWYWLAGLNDTSAFLSGAVMGTLAVAACAALAWLQAGPWAAVAAAWLLALWPVHARLSASDDAWVMVATLLIAAAAFIRWAREHQNRLALLTGWLAALLAILTRPEPILALVVFGGWVLLDQRLRRLAATGWGLVLTGLLSLPAVVVAFCAILWAAEGPFNALACAFSRQGLQLLDVFSGGSILAPPRTPLFLTLLTMGGLGLALARRRFVDGWPLWAALAPAVPLACLSGPDWVTARYQLPLVPVAATLGASLIGWSLEKNSSLRKRLVAAGAWTLLLGVLFAQSWWRPFPQPTFRLEYSFFRENLPRVPADCRLVLIEWPQNDLGLRVPEHLTELLGLGHRWIKPAVDLDVEKECIVYWQPASCRARNPDYRPPDELHPDCRLIESNYRLEPLFVTALPARTGFCETYFSDPVPVGFYRLRAR